MKKKSIVALLLCFILLFQSQITFASTNPYVYTYYNDNGTLCYNCTWYAWQRAYEKLGVALPGFTGNAKGWYQGAINAGYSVGSEPRADSIIVWTDSAYGHVGFVESVDGNNVTVSEAGTNYGTSSYACNTYDKNYLKTRWGQTLLGYIYLTGSTPSGYSPEGGVESLVGGKGQIWMNGWTFDRDAWTSAVTIDVYIGGSSAGSYVANLERTDVGSAYPGAGNYHGFNLTIPTSKTGTQRVEIWARSLGGGGDILLGANDVYIEPADTAGPVFKSAKVVETDAYGYFVECEVTDNSGIDRVMCPTWTEANGQDDLATDWQNNNSIKATLKDGVYTFRVNVSDHNGEYGIYNTHVYAFDSFGNASVRKLSVTITNEKMPKRISRFGNSLYSVYEEGLSWNGAVSYAKSMSSNLVSISNREENNVVYKLINGLYKYGYYIGSYSTSKNDDYKWTDGSSFVYSNWADGEPNYTNNEEFYACMVNGTNGKWNDVGTVLVDGTSSDMGFVIETPLDLQESMILETDTKIYKYYNIPMPYTLAERFCKENGGYLACITSQEENELIASKLYKDNYYYYIGANDIDVEGEFKWVSGEELKYTNWNSGDPNSSNGVDCNEEYVGIDRNGKWRDMTGQGSMVGFIAEFDKTPASSEPSEIPSEAPSVSPSTSPSVPPSEIPSETPNQDTIKGDVNMDKKVDLSDAQLTLKAALKISNLEANQIQVADVDGNGKIELADAQKILKAALKIEAL